jgi:uncharacterized protein (TIGR03435 family)
VSWAQRLRQCCQDQFETDTSKRRQSRSISTRSSIRPNLSTSCAAVFGRDVNDAFPRRRGARCAGLSDLRRTDPEFEVASIKRNTINQFATGPPPNPSSGLFSMINVPARVIVLRAYPVQTTPIEVLGLPSWAESERYDVVAKGKAGATPEEQQQMWRALLADRMKLAAHYETREKPSWDLVFARSDHRLGTQIKPSTLDCSQLAAPTPRPEPGTDMRQMAMNRCSNFFIDRDERAAAFARALASAS